MRWLFLLMLVLNLSYIAWALTWTTSADHAVSQLTVPTIHLLSEVQAGKKIVANSKQRVKPVATEAEIPVEPTVESGAEASDNLAQSNAQGSGQQALRPSYADKQTVSKVVVQQSMAKTKVEDKQNNSAVDTAARVDKPDQAKASVMQAVSARQMVPSTVADQCYALGPFRDVKKLDGINQVIKPYVSIISSQKKKKKKRALYWVYIKPVVYRKQARKIAKRLKQKRIKDFYIIRAGVKKNGISLGRFKSQKRAESLLKKVKKRGFNVVIEPVYRTHTLYWLDYRLTADSNVPESLFEGVLSDKIQRIKHACSP